MKSPESLKHSTSKLHFHFVADTSKSYRGRIRDIEWYLGYTNFPKKNKITSCALLFGIGKYS
jgi:hypothetical protein